MNQAVALRRALHEAARRHPDATAEQLADAAADILTDWQREDALDRELYGEPDDTPCIESVADVTGGEEGRYHGVIA